MRKIGPYDLLELLGRGGMGSVYRARHVESHRIVAVKVMSADAAADPVLLKRFEQEFSAANRLGHPNIVSGLDFGLDAGRPFLVMEFVDGENLAQRVKRRGPLPVVEAIQIVSAIGGGLRLAHRCGIIHRDVKPDNILLARSGQVKLADLGLSKDLHTETSITKSRSQLGTLVFMAPEQFGDAKYVDGRCDVYGLAATLYFAVTGAYPFRGRGNLSVLKKKLANDFPPPSKVVPGLGGQLDPPICRALDFDLARRTSSCDDFIASLLAAVPEARLGLPGDETSPAASGPRAAADRRASIRFPVGIEVSWAPPQQLPLAAEIVDISQTGVRLEAECGVEPGDTIVLLLGEPLQGVVGSLRAEVRWASRSGGKRWLIGAQLETPLSMNQLGALIENRTPTIVADSTPEE